MENEKPTISVEEFGQHLYHQYGRAAIEAEEKEILARYFVPDRDLDRALRGRTLAVLRQIREIDQETTTGEAFRKHLLLWVERTERELGATEVEVDHDRNSW